MADSAIDHGPPLPAELMEPWIEDNAAFIRELSERDHRLSDLTDLRRELEPQIRRAAPTERCHLAAVDAASVIAPLGDQVTILIQVVTIADDGTTVLGKPQRLTGIDGHESRMAATPMRVAAECKALAAVTTPTIADTSYWSFLMETNQAITLDSNHPHIAPLKAAIKTLIENQTFIGMVQNPFVVPMSKTSQSDTFITGVSDRQILGQVLQAGEYILPHKLTDGTTGSFGVEKRGFTDSERILLQDFFNNRLGVLFFKPHPWARAYRIEGHLSHLLDDAWLMPLLAAISYHTAFDRLVVEPWPQFMADYTAKKISGVAKLYGDLNWHRYPTTNYLRGRTR